MDAARLVIANSSPAGPHGATIEVRQVADPRKVVFRTTDAAATETVACVQLAGDWLVRTDVTRVPSDLTPGPPEPWTLQATNMRTSQHVVLDHGLTDMGNVFGCAVADGTRLAWTKAHATVTTTFDLASGASGRVPVAGNPLGWDGDGVLLARPRNRVVHVLRVALGPHAATRVVLTATGVDQARQGGRRLAWWGRENPTSDNFTSHVSSCALGACRAGDVATDRLATFPDDIGWVAVSSRFVAWTAAGPEAPPLTIVDATTGKTVPNSVDADTDVGPLAANDDYLAFVSTPADDSTPPTLHVLTVNG